MPPHRLAIVMPFSGCVIIELCLADDFTSMAHFEHQYASLRGRKNFNLILATIPFLAFDVLPSERREIDLAHVDWYLTDLLNACKSLAQQHHHRSGLNSRGSVDRSGGLL